jgi:hypothetical protein
MNLLFVLLQNQRDLRVKQLATKSIGLIFISNVPIDIGKEGILESSLIKEKKNKKKRVDKGELD